MSKITFTKENRTTSVQEIQAYFQKELDEDIGNLAAEFLLDFILEKIGPVIYNQAIEDAHTLMHQHVDELYSLQKHR